MAKYTTVTKEQAYIPEWDDNREKPEDEQIKFVLRFLTDAERAKCTNIAFDTLGEQQITIDNEYAIRRGVVSISGFTVDGVEITTAKAFLGLSGFAGLFYEIGSEIVTMNAREDTRPLP